MSTPPDVLPDTPSDRLPARSIAARDDHVRARLAAELTDAERMFVHGQVPNDRYDGYDHWTRAALDGLLGQTVRVLIGGDWQRHVGTAVVTGASAAPDGWLVLTLAMPTHVGEAARLRTGSAPQRLGIGFTIADATHNHDLSRRALRDVSLRAVWADGSTL